ncbi:MAG: DUF255 domain-containing protein [Bacteroidota bacterium]
MKFRFGLLLFSLVLFTTVGNAQIEWLTWEDAIARNKQAPKKIMVDIYTEWCGWCKKMDKSVFTDPAVAKYVSDNFYAVKLDAEQRESLDYSGHTFKFKPDAGRRGAHELAITLLEGRMSYPSIVYLDEGENRITISPGFKPADKFIKELGFISGSHYKTKTYQEYLNSLGK